MEHRHPLYPRVVFVCGDTHPAVRPQAEARRPAYDALRQALRERGYQATVNEERGDVWIEALGEWLEFYEAKRLTERRV
jgi:hypothetical protein